MYEQISNAESSGLKRFEHLKEGVSPIFACVGSIKDFEDDKSITRFIFGGHIQNAHNVDFLGKQEDLEKGGFRNDGQNSYVISPIDSYDKYSDRYFNCTGLIVTGIEKGTGRNVSFMSHQDPAYFLKKVQGKFRDDLTERLREIESVCEEGTIDAVIAGGRYAKVRGLQDSDPNADLFIKEYLDSIRFLTQRVKDELGFEPTVITGPKTSPGSDSIFFDNEHKRLFLVRDKGDFGSGQGFTPRELKERRKTWEPGEWSLPRRSPPLN